MPRNWGNVPLCHALCLIQGESRDSHLKAAISTLIVEDEPIARRRLRDILEGMPGVRVVGECEDAIGAAALWRDLRPELLFLDISLAGSNGFDLLNAIPAALRPAIVIVTAASEHACRAFSYDAVDFLLKPFTRERLQQAVEKARRQIQGKAAPEAENPRPHRDHLTIKSNRRYVRIRCKEISAIVVEKHTCSVYVGKEVFLANVTIASLEKQLPPMFVRINRGAIINTEHIRVIHPKSHGDAIVELASGRSHIVSRLYRERLEQALANS